MAAVILCFPLIPPYGNLRSTQEIIDRAASQIDVLDWVLLAVRRGRSKLRPQLWAYAASVLNKEWPAPRDHWQIAPVVDGVGRRVAGDAGVRARYAPQGRNLGIPAPFARHLADTQKRQ
jgi:hypothetical protein